MAKNWTFGKKVGAGFALTVALTLALGVVAIYALQQVVAGKDAVIAAQAGNLKYIEQLRMASTQRTAAVRGYLLNKGPEFLEARREWRERFDANIKLLRANVDESEGHLLDEIEAREDASSAASNSVVALRQQDAPMAKVLARFEDEMVPTRAAMDAAIDALSAHDERRMEERKQAASALADSAIVLVIGIVLLVVVLSILIAILLTRMLGQQIGTAVSQVQSSATELQAAATQQVTGAREQATAMSEITTTISELLATSRQIAESAQRVAQIAGQTASGARAGDATVEQGSEAMASIRRQVDLIVNHMLELGKKSQQIGAVLEIVSELAEQTNILAINATIEAAGAGETGKRFAVVAEEIRKLADRVAGSTKEVRGLIDDVRSAVNTTVMTTETGSKAVEAGARQFAEVASSFREIAALVGTTTEAAKEIELSTKQQATAVEQVNVAITSAAQATRETEASSGQTLQTASQLSGLSRELLQLIQPQATIHVHGAKTA